MERRELKRHDLRREGESYLSVNSRTVAVGVDAVVLC